MHVRPTHIHEALAVLAAPRRFDLLLLMLSGQDRSVSQLAEAVGLSQSCTTRHLQALARAGLVKGARDGKRVVFRVAPRSPAARAVLASLAGAPPEPRAAEAEGQVDGRRPAAGRRARRRRPLLNGAIRIESAAEVEPVMAGVLAVAPDSLAAPSADSPSAPESDRNPGLDAPPPWRRSDLDDFLL
jgi:DNA-binding transcriptional ArsR family regulator